MADHRHEGALSTTDERETAVATAVRGADTDAAAGETGPRTTAPRPSRGAWLRTRSALAVAVALTLVSTALAGWAGWSWYDAAHEGDAAYAEQRDQALSAGEQAVQNLNTLDHREIDDGLDLWEKSTTGELHDQLVQGRAEFAAQVKKAGTTTTAKVLAGAVTELDDRAGRAKVMVAVRITVRAPKGEPSAKDSRMIGELARTAGHWKLSALGQAPVGDTSAG